MRKLILTLGLVGAISTFSLIASAQARREAERVCVYQNNFYGGWEQCYGPGQQIPDLGGRNNQISSIRVYGGAHVTVFTDKDYKGGSMQISSDMNDLAQVRMSGSALSGTWNDRIKSLSVNASAFAVRNDVPPPVPPRYDDRDRDRDYRDDRYGRPERFPVYERYDRRSGVCVFTDANYRGRSQCFGSGEEVSNLARDGNWSDKISSLRIFGSARVTLYRDNDFRGNRVTVDRDIPDLRRLRADGMTWDNQVSSIDVNGGRGRAEGHR